MTREPFDLDAIEARAEAATEGPWFSRNAYDGNNPHKRTFWDVCDVDEPIGQFWWGHAEADAEFVAHARTDVPRLVAEVRSLTAERDAAIERGQNHGCVRCIEMFGEPWMTTNCAGLCAGHREEAEAESRALREALGTLIDEFREAQPWHHNWENAPGHAHQVKERWDGWADTRFEKPCSLCIAWNIARAALAAPPTEGSASEEPVPWYQTSSGEWEQGTPPTEATE